MANRVSSVKFKGLVLLTNSAKSFEFCFNKEKKKTKRFAMCAVEGKLSFTLPPFVHS